VNVTISGSSVSWRSIEKLIAYGAGLVGSTNGFAQLSMPSSWRDTMMAVAAAIVVALHVSGPAATPNTSTSPPKAPGVN
jgi:hypothetical protein